MVGPTPVLFSPYIPQSIMPGEPATASTTPTSATKAPCHPDPSPFLPSYADYVPWSHDPFAFGGSQLPPAFTAPIDTAYYPHSGALGTGHDGYPSSFQPTDPPSSLPFFPVQSFDFGDMRCGTPSGLGLTPDSLPYHPPREPQATGISAGASLDLNLDFYGAWGNYQQQHPGGQQAVLPSHNHTFLATENLAQDAVGPANSGQEANVCSMPPYTSATSENVPSWSQTQPDHRSYVDSTPQSRRASVLQHGERAAGDDASSPESGNVNSLAVGSRKVGLGEYPDTEGSDPETRRLSDAHSQGKFIAAHQLGDKPDETLASCKRPSESPTSMVQTPARGRKRGRLADDVRKGIHATRLIGACIRCHIQRAKVRCSSHLFVLSVLTTSLTSANQTRRTRRTRSRLAKHASKLTRHPRRRYTTSPASDSS